MWHSLSFLSLSSSKPPPLAEFLWKPFWLHQVDFITSLSTLPLHLLQSSIIVDITIILLSVSLSNYHLRLSRFSCVLTLCNPMDCSPPGSSAHRILQARIPEWVAKPSSRGHYRPLRLNPPLLSLLHFSRQDLYHKRHLGNPQSSQQKPNLFTTLTE